MTPDLLHIDEAAGALEMSPSLEAERILCLYRHAPTGLAVNIALASLMTWLLWNRIPQQMLLTWLAALLLVTLVRSYRLARYFRAQPVDGELVLWHTEFLTGSFLSGMVWGATEILFTPFANFET